MCELLGLSSKSQTTINLSLSVLAQRGENPNMHGDGWGVAFHEGGDVRLIKDAGAAKDSPWVEFIKRQEIRSHDIIAHIRKSTVGKTSYSNTHPFIRELLGRVHSFAHNGTLTDVFTDARFKPKNFHPIGDTDSELVFCVLMDRMLELWKSADGLPSLKERLHVVKHFASEIIELGPSNFLYSDGDAFFAHGDERHDPLTHKISWPGLHYTQLHCDGINQPSLSTRESGFSVEASEDVVTLFASVPLDEGNHWIPLKRGEVLAVCKGKVIH
jgi:predicted glutamine amidotransferase